MWTKEEEEILKKTYPDLGAKKILKYLPNKSLTQIYNKVYLMRLKRNWKYIKCPECGNKFKPVNAIQKYCSRKCEKLQHKSKPKKNVKCANCNKFFKQKVFTQVYCSYECQKEFSYHKRPSRDEWFNLIEYILERDYYKCVECESDNKLVVHHIKPLVFGGNNDVSNLETLCIKCHKKKHNLINNNELGSLFDESSDYNS